MFDTITERFGRILKDLRGQGRLTEENISATLREVRMALLEADVALPVVREFVEHVRQQAPGTEVMNSLTPGQALIKIVHRELIALMGASNVPLNLNTPPPAVVLVAGLQGTGKTTTVAKLARYITAQLHKKVLLASCDIYRPAAMDQLQMLARQINVDYYAAPADAKPVSIGSGAVEHARRHYFDVLIVDSAGRLHIDDEMMREIKALHTALNPVETLFVVDSMMGQDAVNVARAFDEALPLTGVVLTKTDGDARGGAALSVRQVTGKPIKFMGTGEKTSALTPFHPERVASRILGMGDVLSLIEEVEQKTDRDKAQKIAEKLQKGKRFTLDDFRDQLQQMHGMGGIGNLLDKLPGLPAMRQQVDVTKGEKEFTRFEAIINSMTVAERRNPDTINGSRKKRIAGGSGTQIQDVNRLLKQFHLMQKMMKRLSGKDGMKKLLRGMGGKLPRGGLPF
jgi:signal recognition particle subunit SRP54